jgi:polyisoprenyl-teichoic acid--peptidoglycan teichoic acid transferase
MAAPSMWRAAPRRFALSLVLLLTTVALILVGVNVLVTVKLASADRVELTLADTPSGGGANYLLIGSDTRSFVDDPADAQAFGETSDAGGQRSDTIMVLHTDPDSDRALLVSFPRDLWVDIPGQGNSKINAAFNDGPQKVIDTLAADFGVPIQHYVEVNFDSFRQLVDAVGTVPVYFPAYVRDQLSGLSIFFPGCADLDGATSLAFVRSRHLEVLDPETNEWEDADAIPDLGRIGRQQAFLRVLGQRAMDEALTNPFQALDIADAAISSLTLDGDFGRTDAFALVDSLAADDGGTAASGPESLTIPSVPATRGGQSVLERTAGADALIARLRDFDTVVPDAPDTGDVTPGDVRVRVLNASEMEGAAAEALSGLTAAGFKDAGTGNADHPLTRTEVHYPPGSEAEARLVASFVTGPSNLVEDESVDGADVTLYLGRTFGGTQAAAGPVGSAAPTADTGIPQPASLAPVPGKC